MNVHPDLSPAERSELQIRTLLGEIAQLSKQEIAPDEFHAEFLRRVVSALGAIGGALWICEGSSLTLAYQINFKELPLQGDNKHTRLLSSLLHSPDSGTLLLPHSGTEGESDIGNPTDFLLIFCPIRTELEIVGLVEVIHRPDAPPAVQKSFVQFLAQTCHFATDYYKNRQLRHFGERQSLWTTLEDFTRTIHQSLDPRETAYTVANEGRRLIGCDRVSVALRSGNVCPITAVSGQDTVSRRSTTVRLLGKLAAAVLKAGEPVLYTGSTADFPPQIEQTLETYVDESHSKMIAVYPLVHGTKEHKEEQSHKQRKRPFGVLIVEQIEDSQVTERTRKRIDIVAEHAGSALGNALEHHSIFLLPLWKLLGKSKKLVAGDALPKTFAATVLILVLIAVLFFLPWKFQMHCTGTLEPVLRQRIYSPIDAEIKELFVDHNSRVVGPLFDEEGKMSHYGTKLLELRSQELENLEIQLLGEYGKFVESHASLEQKLQDQARQLTPYDRTELVGQRDRTAIELATVEKQLEFFYHYQKPDLTMYSPMDGVVVSWRLKDRLVEKRPISRMQYVMEIADLEGPWQLELLMPENRMGYIMEQRRRNPELRVEFVLAADRTMTKYYGTVTEIHDRAEVRSEQISTGAGVSNLNTVAIKVKLDDPEALSLALYAGTACRAKINCDKKPLGYVLFYEVITFIQKNVLFRWF